MGDSVVVGLFIVLKSPNDEQTARAFTDQIACCKDIRLSKQQLIKQNQQQMQLIALLDAIPTIIFGLALHSLSTKPSEPLFEFMAEPMVLYLMLGLSLPCILGCAWRVLILSKQRQALLKLPD